MAKKFQANEIELVIKVTKYCNLRCSYCYEFPFLANKDLISLSDLEKLFANISSFKPAVPSEKDTFSLIWHGGEPFMVKMSYYEQIADIERSVFQEGQTYHNSVQTNLTILSDEQLQDLKSRKFFQEVGFSFDVYGDQRVDVRGRASTDRVLQNFQKLRDNEVPVGAITVLSRSTLPKISNIYKFYERLGVSIRILPYHIETLQHQSVVNGLRPEEIASGLCEVFDLWLQSERPIAVQPLEVYVDSALAYMNNKRYLVYDKEAYESIFIVNTNGDTFGYENYMSEDPYGNLFKQTFDEILCSENRLTSARLADDRVDKYCTDCRFFGACSGYPVAGANALEESWLSSSGCYVAMIIAHMVERLDRAGLGTAKPAPQHHPSASRGL